MQRVQGSIGVKLLECVNPKKDKWRVRWDVQESGDAGSATYMEHGFPYKPAPEEIKELIIGWHNARIDERIRSGFVWEGMPVWLSSENQFNYKAAYDLAIQTEGQTLPVIFKFGSTENPVYHQFNTLEELSAFYTQAMKYITDTLANGWMMKDMVNWSDYVTDV